MKRPLRCRLMVHTWIVKQNDEDGHRFVGCARCEAIKMVDSRPETILGGGPGTNLLFDDSHEINR